MATVSARVPRAATGTFQIAVVGRAVGSAAQIDFKLRYATMGTLETKTEKLLIGGFLAAELAQEALGTTFLHGHYHLLAFSKF